MDTRWYLKRSEPPRTGVMLVVEERAAPHRGYAVSVFDRHHAREWLPYMREQLRLSICRARASPQHAFSALEEEPDVALAQEA